MLIITILCFFIAVSIGAWRQSCIVYEEYLPFNCPTGWRITSVRITTWILTALFSLAYSLISAGWLVYEFNEWIGKFSFGVFLMIRWIASGVGGVNAYNKVKKINNDAALPENYSDF